MWRWRLVALLLQLVSHEQNPRHASVHACLRAAAADELKGYSCCRSSFFGDCRAEARKLPGLPGTSFQAHRVLDLPKDQASGGTRTPNVGLPIIHNHE
jgi:hypothetical protein